MEKYTLHKNKPEVFKCQFQIEGAEPEDTIVRLCLEFDDNKNMFFYGTFGKDGSCEILIPEMKDITKKEGKLVIEAIADSLYFKVYEATVDIKNSVEVKLIKAESSVSESANAKVKLTEVSIDQKFKKNVEQVQEIQEIANEPVSKNPFVLKPAKKTVTENIKIETIKREEKKVRSSFNDYISDK